jgi:hypothetical protein
MAAVLRKTRAFPIPLAGLLSGLLVLATPAKETRPKPLGPYLACGSNDSLIVVDSTARFSGTRRIQVGWKTYDVHVEQGVRVGHAFRDADYLFANVKVERGGKRYSREKGWILEQHRAQKGVRQKGMRQEEWLLNGLTVYGSEEDTLDHGGVIGMYTAFRDTSRLVITAYLLNQGQKARRFGTIEEFRALRAGFLDRLTACVDSVARVYEP